MLVQRERQGRWDMNMITCFFFLLLFVIFQIGLSSSATVDYSRRHFVESPPPPPRKTLMYATAPFRGPLSREDIYGDDKRVVHTGPNPLHN